jgi:hypothetical protein
MDVALIAAAPLDEFVESEFEDSICALNGAGWRAHLLALATLLAF